MSSSEALLGEKLFDGRGGKLFEGTRTSIHRNGIAGEGFHILWPDVVEIYVGGTIDSFNSIPWNEDRTLTIVDSGKNELSFTLSGFFRMKQGKREQFNEAYAFVLRNVYEKQWAKFMETVRSGGHYPFGSFDIARDGFYFSKTVSTWKGPKEAFDKIETQYIKGCFIQQGFFYVQYQDADTPSKIRTWRAGEVQYVPNVHLVRSYISMLNP